MMEHRESTVLFYNVSKKSNSGPIVRSAGAFGVSKIFVVGDARSNKIKFGAQGTHTRIPFEFFPKLKDAVQEIKSRGFAVYGVEIDPNAVALDENPFRDERICFMFGNEGDGLNEKARLACDVFIKIKQFAPRIESLNVAVAAGIVLYSWALWANLSEARLEGQKYVVDQDVSLLIGTYTSKMGHVDGKGKGVYRACLNPHSGLLTKLELVVECADPSYVSLVAGDEMFCAVDEASGAMLLVDVNTGVVKQRVETVGKWPCHICVDNDDVITISGYGGTLCRTRLGEKGLLEEPVSLVSQGLKGSLVNAQRQQESHVHCFVALDEDFGVAVDLGADALVLYETREGSNELVLASGFPVLTVPGGPRHAAVHPKLPLVGYVVSELSNQIFRFSVDAENRLWTLSDPVSTLPDGVIVDSAIAAIVVHPSGAFCYVSNRFHDSLTVFAVAPTDGSLKFLQNISCGGKCPRDMVIYGSLLIVANQNSSNICVFVIGRDGLLAPSQQQTSFPVPTPACVKVFRQ